MSSDKLVSAVLALNDAIDLLEAAADRDRLLARLRWIIDVARTDPRPETALVRIFEAASAELGLAP